MFASFIQSWQNCVFNYSFGKHSKILVVLIHIWWFLNINYASMLLKPLIACSIQRQTEMTIGNEQLRIWKKGCGGSFDLTMPYSTVWSTVIRIKHFSGLQFSMLSLSYTCVYRKIICHHKRVRVNILGSCNLNCTYREQIFNNSKFASYSVNMYFN
jgi:hypothetical protein